MRTLPLYTELPELPVEAGLRLRPDPHCSRCTLRAAASSVCMRPRGEGAREPGAREVLLCVGERPGVEEDKAGRPFVGPTGAYLQGVVRKLWPGPIVYDNAVKCLPGKGVEVVPSHVEACRPYLSATVRAVRPARILALGSGAIASLTGRDPAVLSTRRGYTYLAGAGAPVFYLLHPAAALRNRFVREWFEGDLRWALGPDTNPSAPPWDGVVRVVETVEEARAARAALSRAPWVAFDVETVGVAFSRHGVRIVSLAFTPAGEDDSYLWPEEAIADPAIRREAELLLADPAVGKVGQNGKYDIIAVGQAWGVEVRNYSGDTMLRRRLLEPDAEAKLSVSEELVGMGGAKGEMDAEREAANVRARKLLDTRASPQRGLLLGSAEPELLPRGLTREEFSAAPGAWNMALCAGDLRDRYNARDTVATARLEVLFRDRLSREPELSRVWEELIAPATETVVRMETWGIGVDVASVQAFASYLAIQRGEALARIHAFGQINPEAHHEVRELLYEKLRLRPPPGAVTEKGGKPSTESDVLKLLRQQHPAPQAILDYRRFARLDSVYATGLLPFVQPDGRVHANINVLRARTGRFSITDPPLQTIPRVVDEEGHTEGKMARDCFVAGWEALHPARWSVPDRTAAPWCDFIPPGEETELLVLDYSQIELRVLADLSGDPKMLAAFRSGEDFHLRTARSPGMCAVFKITPEQVAKQHRDAAKIVNFSLAYGKGDDTLADDLTAKAGRRITSAEAGAIREAILGEFSVARDWMQAQLAYSRKHGCAWTYWRGLRAQRRPLHHIGDAEGPQKGTAERSSWNTPVQGTAGLYCNASLNAIVAMILRERLPAKVVLTVHDSIVLESLKGYTRELARRCRAIMTGWPTVNGVPLVVDAERGHAWGSLEKIKDGE